MTKQKDEYRALVGMDYKNDKDEEVRVEAGDKIPDMPEDELRHQIRVGNAEVWVERQTGNVVDHSSVPVEVQGVLSRHANEGQDIVLTDAAVKAEQRGEI